MTEYRCHFYLNRIIKMTKVPCIADAKDGFWINDHYQFTKLSDCRFWIPPGQILYIEKMVMEDE